jgi:hypothetical protein
LREIDMRIAPTSSKTRPTIASRLAAAAAAIALVAPLPDCGGLATINSADIRPTYDAWGIVRNAAGVEVVVRSDADSLFADEMFVLAVWDGTTPDERIALVRSRFRRAVRRRLEAVAGDAGLAARFGEGPWCFASVPTMTQRMRMYIVPPLPAAELGEELHDCEGPPPPPECADFGDAPVLLVDPPEVSFGAVSVMTTAPPSMAISVTNEGTGSLCLASIVHAGPHARDFVVDDSDCRPSDPAMARRVLDSGASCTVRVTFLPLRLGAREATLRISSNDAIVLREFALSGTGLTGTLVPRPGSLCAPRGADACYRGAHTFTNPGPGGIILRGIYVDNVDWEFTCTPAGAPPTATQPVGAQTVPVGGTVTCAFHSCLAAPRNGSLVVDSDGLADEPATTVFAIPIATVMPPATCPP